MLSKPTVADTSKDFVGSGQFSAHNVPLTSAFADIVASSDNPRTIAGSEHTLFEFGFTEMCNMFYVKLNSVGLLKTKQTNTKQNKNNNDNNNGIETKCDVTVR